MDLNELRSPTAQAVDRLEPEAKHTYRQLLENAYPGSSLPKDAIELEKYNSDFSEYERFYANLLTSERVVHLEQLKKLELLYDIPELCRYPLPAAPRTSWIKIRSNDEMLDKACENPQNNAAYMVSYENLLNPALQGYQEGIREWLKANYSIDSNEVNDEIFLNNVVLLNRMGDNSGILLAIPVKYYLISNFAPEYPDPNQDVLIRPEEIDQHGCYEDVNHRFKESVENEYWLLCCQNKDLEGEWTMQEHGEFPTYMSALQGLVGLAKAPVKWKSELVFVAPPRVS